MKFRKKDTSPIITIDARKIDPLKFPHEIGELPTQLKVDEGNGFPAGTRVFWLITVEDNGIGFDEKYSSRIFKPFKRLHVRDQFPGSGMGLAICQKIVARLGGSITARGIPNVGAKFMIYLPEKQQS